MNNDDIVRNLDRIVENFLSIRDAQGQLLASKYSINYIYSLVQKHLFDYEAIFNNSQKAVIDVFDFVITLLQFAAEPFEETIFIIVQAIDFFKTVCEELQTNQLRFSDLSSYLCRYNPNLDEVDVPLQNRIITTHAYPPDKLFNKPKHRQVRSIDVHAPTVLGTLGHHTKRINKDKVFIDSQKNSNSSIVKVQYQLDQMRLVTLHQYSDKLYIYNPDCSLDRELRAKAPQLKNIIHDFAWSEDEQRIGLAIKDAYLCFMDASDNYQFEKFFSSKVDQTKLFYVQSRWMSVAQDSKVTLWNLETEDGHTIVNEALKGVVTIEEVKYLQLVCVACIDKMTLWDMVEEGKPKLLFKLQTNHTRLNNLVYFHTYHLLITSGFDQKVNLYQLHKKYNDGDYVGSLEGHTSIITAIQCIEHSPVVITCDDRHIIKLWDVRIMKCIQSFDLELKQSICHCTPLPNLQSVAFGTNRLLVMSFEGRPPNLKQPKPMLTRHHHLYPLGVEIDALKQQLIVATAKDVRLISLLTGQTETIIKAMIGQNDDEITKFRPMKQFKKLLLGTSKGALKVLDVQSGEVQSEQQPHHNKVTQLSIDYQNRLVISSSLDGTWIVAREKNLAMEQLRKAENVHSAVDICYVSLYHGLIVTGGLDVVAIWNIEFGKLIGTLRPQSQPVGLYILDGYSTLVIGGREATHFIHFSAKEDTIAFEQLAHVEDSCHLAINHKNRLLCANKHGKLYQIDAAKLKNPASKASFNSFRQSWEDYTVSLNNHKVQRFILGESPLIEKIATQSVHKKRITHLDIVQLEGDNVLSELPLRVITASKDSYIKILSFPSLEVLCQLNINHPLPTQWRIYVDDHEIVKFKIAFALKIVHHLRSRQNLTVTQIRQLEPNNLFRKLLIDRACVRHKQSQSQPQVELLQNFYEPKDLQKSRQKVRQEAASLQQLEERKKQIIYAQEWQQQQSTQDQEIKQLDEAQKEFKQLQTFLHPNFRQMNMKNQLDYIENVERIHQFEKKLDRVLAREDDHNKRRQSKQNLAKLKEIPSQNRSAGGKLRQSVPFFKYATDRKLASLPQSTDTTLRSTHCGFETDRDEYSRKLVQRSKFLSQNIGSLVSDLQDSQKKTGLEVGENTMRKTSSLLFNQIVSKLNVKLREAKFKKVRVGGSCDMDGVLIDAQLERLLTKKYL